MNNDSFFRNLYKHFNDRAIESVIASMDEDVQWANGMDGGYVYGHEGVRIYWTRQFSMVSSKVRPLDISKEGNNIKIKVHQVVHDLKGNLLSDEIVYHSFQLKGDKISRFDIATNQKK